MQTKVDIFEQPKTYKKVPFTVAFGEAVNILPGGLPETVKGDLLHYALMNAQLMLSKRIFYKRWAIEKGAGRLNDGIDIGEIAEVTPEEESKLMAVSKVEYQKVKVLRTALQIYFDLNINPYFEDGIINELEDDFNDMAATNYDEFSVQECLKRYNAVQEQLAQMAAAAERTKLERIQATANESKEN